jgi:sugar/nucleoside kinase (ribokinase family)
MELVVAGNLAEDVVFGKSHYGGSAGNIALNASVFGLETAIVSNYGRDSFSGQYVAYLKSRNVNVDLLQPGIESIAQCIVRSSANHSSSKEWVDNGTSEALKAYVPTEVQRKRIEGARFLHLTTTPGSLATILSGIDRPGGMLGYEPGPRLGDEDEYFLESVFRKSDVLFVNEEELRNLENTVGAVALRGMLRDGQYIVATKGKDGAELIMNGSTRFYPVDAVPGSSVVDSNGAGDAFKSGFYVGLAKTGNIDNAIEYGNILGSHLVQRRGALIDEQDRGLLPIGVDHSR